MLLEYMQNYRQSQPINIAMKILLIVPDVTSKNILQSYVGNMSYNLVKYCEDHNINYDTDFTIMKAIKDKVQDYTKIIDGLDVGKYEAIIITGLCTLDKFLPASFSTYMKSKMKDNALLCQTSDYPTTSPRADITFSTKITRSMKGTHYIGWGADPDYYQSRQEDSNTIKVLLDHTHYVEGQPDSTASILKALRNIPNVEIKRIGNNGKILGPDDPIEVYDRSGLPNQVYRDLLAETHVFIPTHVESVGLSVLEAGMSGCLVLSQTGFIFQDRLDTVKHVLYNNKIDWQNVLSNINPVESRRQAMDNTWDNVFKRMMDPIMFRQMTMDNVRRNKGNKTMPYAVYVEEKSSADLLVYFGNYNGHIRGISTVEALKCNALFMRSDEATWYLQDFPFGKTPEAVAEAIDTFVAQHPHIKRVVFGGFSMGGFAALLYGSFSKTVNKIVASSPQTRFPDFAIQSKVPVINPAFEEYSTIKKIWDRTGVPTCQILLQACERNLDYEGFVDYQECLDLEGPENVKIKVFDCEGHNGISTHLLSDLDYYNNIFLYSEYLEA
ncbi:hypothetical protein [Stenotrophomonas phage RAS14]